MDRDYGSSGDVAIINGPLPSARYAAELASYDSASSAAGPNGRTRYGMSSGGGPSSFNVFSHDGQVGLDLPFGLLNLRDLQSEGGRAPVATISGADRAVKAAVLMTKRGEVAPFRRRGSARPRLPLAPVYPPVLCFGVVYRVRVPAPMTRPRGHSWHHAGPCITIQTVESSCPCMSPSIFMCTAPFSHNALGTPCEPRWLSDRASLVQRCICTFV